MPTLAINCRALARGHPTGMQRAARALVNALVACPRETEILLLVDKGDAEAGIWQDVPLTRVVHVPWRSMARVEAQLFEQMTLPRLVSRVECSVVLHPLQTCPVRRTAARSIVTVHDLHFLHHPEWFGRAFWMWNRTITVYGIRRAHHVVAISDHVLGDVRRTLKIPVVRSSRVYNVGPAPTSPVGSSSAPDEPPTILCVNPFQPHKNLGRVLAAFAMLRAEYPELQLHLVGRSQENFARLPGLERLFATLGVHLLGYLSDEQLAAEYARCTVFCYPSLSEGFGLPVLEAAVHGAVVVTSSTSCLPEIAADTAILVDPHSVHAIAGGLRCALQMSPGERAEFVRCGRANLHRFRPEAAASAYLALFDALVGQAA